MRPNKVKTVAVRRLSIFIFYIFSYALHFYRLGFSFYLNKTPPEDRA